MGQTGFFDLQDCYGQLDKLGDALSEIDALVPWEEFRPSLRAAWRKEGGASAAGRKPHDEVLMLKVLLLSGLYNLSDDATERAITDRLSFRRFLGLGLSERSPDAKTIWLYRERLTASGLSGELFAQFEACLRGAGLEARGGQIIDATLVRAPVQRNTRSQNERIKSGEVPEEWLDDAAKLRQKDVDASWTRQRGERVYGYKNHVCVDSKHKLVRKFEVTTAATHETRVMERVVDDGNAGDKVWADRGYASAGNEQMLRARGLQSRILRKGARGRKANGDDRRVNKARAKVRARVEHVFGSIKNELHGGAIRSIGLARAEVRICLAMIGYNLRRWTFLARPPPRTG